MMKYAAVGFALLALACGDDDGGPRPATAPDAGHRFVESESPAASGAEDEQAEVVRPGEVPAAGEAAEVRESGPAEDALDRSATNEDSAKTPAPPPAGVQ